MTTTTTNELHMDYINPVRKILQKSSIPVLLIYLTLISTQLGTTIGCNYNFIFKKYKLSLYLLLFYTVFLVIADFYEEYNLMSQIGITIVVYVILNFSKNLHPFHIILIASLVTLSYLFSKMSTDIDAGNAGYIPDSIENNVKIFDEKFVTISYVLIFGILLLNFIKLLFNTKTISDFFDLDFSVRKCYNESLNFKNFINSFKI